MTDAELDDLRKTGEAADAIAALRAERDAHHDAAACVRNDIKEMQRNLGAAERERDALREQVEAFRREQIARSKIDPVTRLHNLCDHLADQRRESPFTAESLELADASYKELCADNAALRDALTALLGQVNNIEVLGEWSALDMNITMSKKVRATVDRIVKQGRDALLAGKNADALEGKK